MKLFNKVAAIAVGVMLATGVGAGVVLGNRNLKEVKADSSVTLEYSGTETGNFGTENEAETVGLSATDWSVIADKGSASNNVGYNKAGDIRLYYNVDGSNTLTVSSLNSWTITTITLTYTGQNYNNATITPGTGSNSGTTGTWTVNSTSFVVGNGNSSNVQVRISSIVINYSTSGSSKTETATTVTAAGNKTTLDVTASPADTVKLTATVTYNSGASTISNPGITWSSDNTSVATVSNAGLVTAVSTGVAEITASYAGDNTYAGSSGKKTITVANPNEVVFDAGVTKGSTTANNSPDSMTNEDITVSSTDAALATAEYRLYSGSDTTISRSSGKIASIVFTKAGSYSLSNLSIASGSTGTYSNGVWEGAASSITFHASAQVRLSKIVVTYLSGPDATLDKETLTLTASGSNSTVAVSSVSNITNPSYQWAVATGDDCVTLTNATSATVTVAPKSKFATCTLRVTINGTNLAEAITRDVSVNVVRASSPESPFDIGEAKSAVDYNDSTYTGTAYVAGIVSEVDSYDSTYKSITYWISDDGTTTNQFEVYSGKGLNGADFASLSDVLVGAEVVVKGSIKKYNSDYEFNYNSELVSYIAPDYETYKVTYSAPDKDGGTVPTDHNSYRDDAEVTVLGNTGDITRDGYVFTGWSDGNTTYLAGDTFNIHDDVTLTAVWSEVIDSNITMTPGDHGSAASVVTTNSETKPAVKCGTGSAAGNMTLTLKNSGLSKIKVYIAGWNNDGNHTIDVSIDSGSISPESVTITSDSGISGSATTFTLGAAESTYAFDFTLTNAPANAVITLAAHTEKNNRFVVWGATDLLADTFSSDFLTKLVCNSEGTSQPTYTNSYSWSKFNSIYNSMDYDEKAKLHDATANQSGTDIQKAMAKYDYIVGKYLKGQGIAAYNDFIGRNPAKIGASRLLNMFNEETGTAAAMVVVVVSAVSVTALGGFFLLKKKPF